MPTDVRKMVSMWIISVAVICSLVMLNVLLDYKYDFLYTQDASVIGGPMVYKTKYVVDNLQNITTNAKYSEDIIINSGGHLLVTNGGSIEMLNKDSDYMYNIFVYGTLELQKGSYIFSEKKMKIELFPGSKLIMSGGSALNFSGEITATQASIQITDSKIGGDKGRPVLNLDCTKLVIWNAEIISCADINIYIAPGPRNDDASTNDEFSIIDTKITINDPDIPDNEEAEHIINISSEQDSSGNIQPLEIINITSPQIRTTNQDTMIYIYRWLEIRITDYFSGLPIGGFEVSYEYLNPGLQNLPEIEPPSNNILTYLGIEYPPDYYKGNNLGIAKLALIGDTISMNTNNGRPYFVGNYKIHTSFYDNMLKKTYTYEESISFEEFPASGLGSASGIILDLNFTNELIPPQNTFFSQEQDTSSPVRTFTEITSDQPISGDLVIEENGYLRVSNAILSFQQTEDLRYYILIKDNATLELDSSTIISDYPINIYLYDNATLKFKNSGKDNDMWINMIAARDNSKIYIEHTTLHANINTLGADIEIINSNVSTFGKDHETMGYLSAISTTYLILDTRNVVIDRSVVSTPMGYLTFDFEGTHYDNITITESTIDATDKGTNAIRISKSNFFAMNSSFYGLTFDNAKATITNISYYPDGGELVPEIVDTQTVIEKYWWVFVRVLDKYGVPVGGKMSANTSDDIYVSVTPLVPEGSNQMPQPTNDKGYAVFWLKSTIITKNQYKFVGRYRFEATFWESSAYIVNSSVDIAINETRTVNMMFDKGPYLYVQSIETPFKKMEVGRQFPIWAYIVNDGDLKATHVRVEFYDNNELFFVDYIDVPSVNSGNPVALANGMWTPESTGKHIIEVRVDPQYYDIKKSVEFIVYNEDYDIIIDETSPTVLGSQGDPEEITAFVLVYSDREDEKGELTIEYNLIMDLEEDYQYEISIKDNGIVKFINSNFSSTRTMRISMDGNAELRIQDSLVDLKGGKICTLTPNAEVNVTIENSVINGTLDLVGNTLTIINSRILGFGMMNLSFSTITIVSSMLLYDDIDIKCEEIEATDTLLAGMVVFTGHTKAKLTNVSQFDLLDRKEEGAYYDPMAEIYYITKPLQYTGMGNVVINIYWWLDVYVYDKINFTIENANVKIKDQNDIDITDPDIVRYVDAYGNLVEGNSMTTDKNGHVRFWLLGKIYTPSDENRTKGIYTIKVLAHNPVTDTDLEKAVELTITESNALKKIFMPEIFRKPSGYEFENMDIYPYSEVYEGGKTIKVSFSVKRIYNGTVYDYAPNASVCIVIKSSTTGKIYYNSTQYADSNGRFNQSLDLPLEDGQYIIEVSVWEIGNIEAKNTTTIPITIKSPTTKLIEETGSLLTWILSAVIILVLLIVVVILILRVRRRRKSEWEDEWDEEEEEEEDYF